MPIASRVNKSLRITAIPDSGNNKSVFSSSPFTYFPHLIISTLHSVHECYL